jgi:parallel beta-helix repeat protein
VDSEGVTVTGNKITHASSLIGQAIYVTSSSATAHLKHIVVIRNTVSNNGGGGIFIGQIYSPTYPPIEDVVVSFNTVDNNGGTGIDLQGPVTGVQVSANTITNNGLDGIHSLINSKITISGNLIRHNLRDGIVIVSSNGNQVIGNTVSESRYGIYLATGVGFTPPIRNVIMFNTAKGNFVYDLYWDGTGTGNVWKLNSYDTKNW